MLCAVTNNYMHLDVRALIESLKGFSYLAIWAIIFAESGLLIGFFLPGDSLLVAAGFAASQNLLNIWILIIGCLPIIPDNVKTRLIASLRVSVLKSKRIKCTLVSWWLLNE